jgi:hypothetical protein
MRPEASESSNGPVSRATDLRPAYLLSADRLRLWDASAEPFGKGILRLRPSANHRVDY